MRCVRALLGTAGALALTAGGAATLADNPTQIRLAEVYEMTPGVSATHQVTLVTDQALIGEQCQSMGTAAKVTSSLLVTVDGVDGCRFTWDLEDGGAEVVSVDDGGVFHFKSTSTRLLEGFATPDAVASIESVTLIAHSSVIVDASNDGQITTPGASTKTDASTVTWHDVTGNVSATGTVDTDAPTAAPSPSPSPSAPVAASSDGRVHTSTARSLTPIAAITGSVLALAVITGLARRSARSRQVAADAQFERDATLRDAQRRSASTRKSAATPYGRRSLAPTSSTSEENAPASAQACDRPDAQSATERFSPPDHS